MRNGGKILAPKLIQQLDQMGDSDMSGSTVGSPGGGKEGGKLEFFSWVPILLMSVTVQPSNVWSGWVPCSP